MAIVGEYPLPTYQQDLQLFNQMLTVRSPLDGWARDVAENLLPNRPRFLVEDNDTGRRNEGIFDSTPVLACRTAVGGFMEGMVSPASPWVLLGVDDDKLANNPKVKYYLDYVNKKIMRTYDRSNFYREMANHFKDLLSFPSAVTLMEPDEKFCIRLNTLSWGCYVIGVDKNGDVDTIGREEEYTVRQLVPKFCKLMDNGEYDLSNLSIESQNAWQQGETNNAAGRNIKIKVRQMIMPNPAHNPNKPHAKFKKWVSRYFELVPQGVEGKFLRESGFDYFPAIVSRWDTRSQEVYASDCPALQILGDILQLYKNTEDENHLIDLINDPPLIGPDSFNNEPIQKGPGGFTPDNSQNKDAGLRPLFPVASNPTWVKDKKGDIRSIINRGFFVDLFMAVSSLRQSVTGQVTAAEIDALKNEKMVELGPVTQSMFRTLRHCIDVTYILLNEAGELPPPPDELVGHDLPPEFISPFARAQKTALLSLIDKLLAVTAQIAELGDQDILTKVNFDAILDEISRILNLPPDFLRPADVVAQLRQQAAQARQAAQNAESLSSATGAAKNLAQSPTDGNNLLTQLMGLVNGGQIAPKAA